MSEKELKMFDVDAQLDAVFGKEGTPERKAAEDRANAFFTGQIIEEARKKANMTQAELAEKIGTNKSYISRVETGKTEPSLKTIVKLAELYKVSTDMILGRKQKVINKPLERRVLKIYEIENTVKKRT